MNLVAKAFDEGVKAALKIIKGTKIDGRALAKAGDQVRRAMEHAAKAAAKTRLR